MPHESQIKSDLSPLRYPGGKGVFAPYFADLMTHNGLKGGKYFEPFAGGSGVALGLLFNGYASEIVLNDVDYHIYCFWKSIIEQNQRFLDSVEDVSLDMKEWNKQKEIYLTPKKYTVFEVAFSTFYLNRCNRSGILLGAGPIGGYSQQGKWRLDARFNKETLKSRILEIGTLKDQITVKNMDAIEFLKQELPKGKARKKVLVYSDPPYVSAGNKLYFNSYHARDHIRLAEYLLVQKDLKWVVTYDDNPLIRELYASCQRWLLSIGYSLQSKQEGSELLIAPSHVFLPKKNESYTTKWNPIRKIKISNKPVEVLA